jgi:hypothetical protein
MLGSLIFGMGMGLQNGWIEVNWEKVSQDLNIPDLSGPDPFRTLREAKDKPPEDRQAR